MVNYRRNLVPGGTYFFTVALHDRSSEWLVTYVHLLRRAFHQSRTKHPFTIDAVVILPEHLHCIWTLPPGDADYAQRWRLIKASFSHSLYEAGKARKRNTTGELDVWQRRFWEHTIRDEADLETHVNYIHYNPVKHGIVNRAVDWPHSSFHRFVRLGMIDIAWAGDSELTQGSFGE
ncbi:MAG TPA: transposase [Candidatus Binatia bacterium]|nr:transposase [Candidatus Binatia bacterium]